MIKADIAHDENQTDVSLYIQLSDWMVKRYFFEMSNKGQLDAMTSKSKKKSEENLDKLLPTEVFIVD